ncbi:Collectin-12 [Mactra antiquata]
MKDCAGKNSHLLAIETSDEETYIRHRIRHEGSARAEHKSCVWSGGTDADTEGFWKWAGTDESIAQYTNWDEGEPGTDSNVPEEDCICLDGNHRYRWQDTQCTERHFYICEAK